MRVRYGKPIKVSSLLGKVNTPITISSTSSNYILAINSITKSFYLGSGIDMGCSFNIASGHSYFMALQVKDMTSTNINYRRFALWDKTNNAFLKYPSTTANDDVLIAKYSSSISTEVYNTLQCKYTTDGVVGTPCWWIFIDLTEIGLDNLTAQEFYDKYNKYFPLIATGEEITIDDKAGQISLKEKNSNNTISCKVSGGSSDIYYGYNQQIENGKFENGTDRWFMQNGTFSVHDGIATFTQTDLSVGFTRLTQKLINPSIIGHKYFVHFYAKHDHPTTINLKENSNHNTNTFDVPTNTWTLCEVISISNAISNYATISTRNSELASMCNVDIRDYSVIDLTDWYGTGKEPSTVEGFKERFTRGYYGFCPTPIKLTQYQIENEPTYGYNQLCINGDFSNGKSSWIDWNSTTVVTNGIAEITRTNTSQSSLHQDISANPGDKIYVRATMWSDGITPVRLGLNGGISWSGTATTSTTPVLFEVIKPIVSTGAGCRIELFGTGVANTKYYVKEVNAINLTDWYGEGDEPATIEEFKATFPNKHYPYSKKRPLNKYMINKLEN